MQAICHRNPVKFEAIIRAYHNFNRSADLHLLRAKHKEKYCNDIPMR